MMPATLRVALASLLLSSLAGAQASLTRAHQPPPPTTGELSTEYTASSYFPYFEAGMLFDVQVLNPAGLNITALDVKTDPGSTNPAWIGGVPMLTLDVYITKDTWVGSTAGVGKHKDPTQWVLVSSGQAEAVKPHTHVDVSDFFLAPGDYGFYLVYSHPRKIVAPFYTPENNPQTYENSDLRLICGGAKPGPAFSPNVYYPRIWNGTFHYEYGNTAAYGWFGPGCQGTNGTPRLEPFKGDLPTLGSLYRMQVTNLPLAGGPVLMNYGFASLQPPQGIGPGAQGCMQWTVATVQWPISNLGGTANYGTLIPNDPNIAGLLFYNQAIVTDPTGANPGNLTVSNASVGRMGL